MQLLKKSQLQAQAQEQKRQQIDEGVAIAKRIDTMRGVLAELEKRHREFVEGSQEKIRQALAPLYEEKAKLEQEIAKLKHGGKS